jgi:hypothetical protein
MSNEAKLTIRLNAFGITATGQPSDFIVGPAGCESILKAVDSAEQGKSVSMRCDEDPRTLKTLKKCYKKPALRFFAKGVVYAARKEQLPKIKAACKQVLAGEAADVLVGSGIVVLSGEITHVRTTTCPHNEPPSN